MDESDLTPLQQASAKIILEDDLPHDLMNRATEMLSDHQDHLYEWGMQLAPLLTGEDIQVIGILLEDAVEIVEEDPMIASRDATTLPSNTRDTLIQVVKNDSDLSDQAAFVLGLDVYARAHNRTR